MDQNEQRDGDPFKGPNKQGFLNFLRGRHDLPPVEEVDDDA